MLEGLAAWVLNTYVGEYVENLNTAQLSIALLQGAVELENLPLKKDALKSLDIPIEVKSGFIGKIRLNIPLHRLRSEPWVISIEKLYLVAGPLSKLQYDEEKEKKKEQAEKKAMLETLEEKWKALRQSVPVDSSNTSWFSYGASMATNILENIQLKVNDVHIRYEDDILNPHCPFAVGIVIKNLSAQSTDASWTPKFVNQNEAEKMFKLVDLQNFSLYCDANVSMLGHLSGTELADELQREMFRTTSNQFSEHNYILKPIMAQAKVTRNMSALPLRASSNPRIQLELVLEELPLILKTEQFQSLTLWQKEFSRHGIRRRFRSCRPTSSISESPRDWWNFAQQCHLRMIKDRNQRSTKAFLVDRAHLVASYVSVYSTHLRGDNLSVKQKATKNQVEEDLSFEELKLIREAVMCRLHKENEIIAFSSRKSPTHHESSPPVPSSLSSSSPHSVTTTTTMTTATALNPQPPPPPPPPPPGTLFQRWFPGWSGWSSSNPASSQQSLSHSLSPSSSSSTPSSSSQDLSQTDSLTSSQNELGGLPHSVSTTTLTEGDVLVDEMADEEVKVISTSEDAVPTEDEIEQEIQDVIKDSWENSSFLRKDTVFARATFVLKKASFRLVESCQIEQGSYSHSPLVELQCTDIGMEFESRPRTSAMKFSLTLGGLLVLDQTAANSVFSHVICPQSKDPHSRSVLNPAFHQTNGRSTEQQQQQQQHHNLGDKKDKESNFFKLGFEKNLHQYFKYRVTMKTQPLDIIYSPELIRKVKAMFTVPTSGSLRSSHSVSPWQFEKLRKQTQEELKNTLDQLLEGKASRWGVNFDICAPKFIIPENMTDPNPELLVLDLGNFHLKTVSSVPPTSTERERVKEEDEDKFETPLSTPPNETEEDKVVKQTLAQSGGLSSKPGSPANLSDDVFRNKLYEKYAIELTEMQVLVGHLHDNWRQAYPRGINVMNIVDRFSISIQLERRLIVTADPQWPTAKISGNLPSLTFHLNERKIQALQICMERLSDHHLPSSSPHLSHTQPAFSSLDRSFAGPSYLDSSTTQGPDLLSEQRREAGEDNKLMVMQFLVNSLKMEVESQGKALIELQVTRVKLDVHNKPLNTSLVLTVHSLLLVDALQTYGRDFELLVASHKNIILDSRSGSIRGSEINSPMSPLSPSSPASPSSPVPGLTPSISFASFQSIQDAISNAFHAVMPISSHTNGHDDSDLHGDGFSSSTFNQSKALILLDYEVITTPASSTANGQGEETTRILRLQFNSLDFIANQETLMEIMSFVNRVFPMPMQKEPQSQTSSQEHSELNVQAKKGKDTLHVNADFKRLNVMMLHFQKTNDKKEARKVATATMSCARLEALLEESWMMEGSLGGFHLLDVTNEDKNLYQHVISIGQFQQAEATDTALTATSGPTSPVPLTNQPPQNLPTNTSIITTHEDVKKACTFVIKKATANAYPFPSGNYSDDEEEEVKFLSGMTSAMTQSMPKLSGDKKEEINASFDMASLCYVHCPKFLEELMDCVSEFKDHVTKWADSIKSAATEVAMGMVGVRGDTATKDGLNFSTVGEGTLPFTSSPMYAIRRDYSLGDITNTVLLEDTAGVFVSGGAGESSVAAEMAGTDVVGGLGGVLINVKMESPILIIPRTPNNPQVLLAHLGEILVDNSIMQLENNMGSGDCLGNSQDLINISLTNMNLYSVKELDMAFPVVNSLSVHLSEVTQKSGVPILYDTSIDLVIGKRDVDIPFINPDISEAISGMSNLGNLGSPRRKFSANKDIGRSSSSSSSKATTLKQHSLSSILEVRAKISSPLMLKLSKEVYEQILQTVDNLTYDGDVPETITVNAPSAGLSSPLPSTTIPVPPMSHKVQGHGDVSQDASGSNNQQSGGEVENFLAKHVEFDVPLFQVELRWDFGEGEQGLVELNLYDFALQFEKNEKATTKINIRLKSLQMDDLLEPLDSKYRQIIMSRPSQAKEKMEREHLKPKGIMSTSCPDSTIIAPIPQMPPSLPTSFSTKHPPYTGTPQHPPKPQQIPLQAQHRSASKSQRWFTSESPQSCPCTPPPSPLARDLSRHKKVKDKREDDLVQIDVILVDKKRPEYITVYNKTNRYIDINFACLDATINLQTWVVLLDFLGLGAKVHDVNTQGPGLAQTQPDEGQGKQANENDPVNSDINFKVESFTLILNKPEYELARATAANLHAHIDLRDGNLAANGELGSLSLLDQSPNGHMYRQRFVSVGRQLVEFDVFKYGLPDFANQRECDISLKLRMSSVRYIHTNRFQSEMVAFIQHFLQLQDILGRMRAASDGKKINEKATRGARIKLDIEAASPILLIPHSSETTGVLVADLGNLKLNNCFIYDGEEGTLRAAANAKDASNSKESSSSSNHQPKDQSAFQKGIIHRGMTESQLNMSYPPTRPVDPMSQSIYGSLDHDTRSDSQDDGTALGWNANMVSGGGAGRGMKRHLSDSSIMGRMQVGSRLTTAPGKPGHYSLSEAEESKEENEASGADDNYCCLLDIISVTLKDMDLFTAKRVWKSDYKGHNLRTDMEFNSFVLEREHGRLLEEKCHLELHIEHNLEGEVSHNAPDFSIKGRLSSVNCRLDGSQYQLVRGILNHNLGEKLEEFRRPLMSHLLDPKIETVLSGNPWKVITLVLDLRNVTVELLQNHPSLNEHQEWTPERSLGRLDFIRSQLSFSSSSNQLREVGLVSNEILIFDTRFKNEPVNSRPNVFTSILQPSTGSKGYQGLQVEMQLLMSPDSTHFTCMLNNMRLMCIFDWLLAMREFLVKEPPNPFIARESVHPSTQAPECTDPTPVCRGGGSRSPPTVSKGIITKRGPWVEERQLPFELVLNFTDTQFVVVENSSSVDTNAVILKNTAVIKYKPKAPTKVLTCSLQSVELFSCCLKAEEETALSIVDPTGISVELNANPLPQPNSSTQSSGLLGLKEANRRQLVLEVDLKTLNIRVSYHDIVMFLAILNSLPQQALDAQKNQESSSNSSNSSNNTTSTSPKQSPRQFSTPLTPGSSNPQEGDAGFVGGVLRTCASKKQDKEIEVIQLMDMGFSEADVRKALAATGWSVESAAVCLTENFTPISSQSATLADHKQDGNNDFTITSVEMKADSIVLCLIDDCGDADIPLMEVGCNALKIEQQLEPCVEGKASFQLLAEYYNRRLSGWEPCLEPWKCLTEWKQYTKPEKKMAVQIAASEVLNLNVTSTLIELYNQTKGTWTQDYLAQKDYRGSSRQQHISSLSAGTGAIGSGCVAQPTRQLSQSGHRRSPFIPYTIKNETGCDLHFLTSSTAPSYLSGDGHAPQAFETAYSFASEWKRVKSGETKPFHFHPREKLRHQKTHTTHINQLHVMVEGWQRLSPIFVDKVGVYFRHAEPGLKAMPNTPPARIVFEVQQEGGARKVIMVRSSLVIRNRLDSPLELRMDSPDGSGQYLCREIPKGAAIPIPLPYVYWNLRSRPLDMPVQFSTRTLEWKHVTKIGDRPDGTHTCDFLDKTSGTYR